MMVTSKPAHRPLTAAMRLHEAKRQIGRSGIDEAAWNQLVFESGCMLVERQRDLGYLHDALLQNPAIRFWDWWLLLFAEDDALLIELGLINSADSYRAEKYHLASSEAADYHFNQFLRSNPLLNGKKI